MRASRMRKTPMVGVPLLPLRLLRFEPGDDARPEEEADEERGHQGAARAEGDIAEQIERTDLVGERNEEMKQHADLTLDGVDRRLPGEQALNDLRHGDADPAFYCDK